MKEGKEEEERGDARMGKRNKVDEESEIKGFMEKKRHEMFLSYNTRVRERESEKGTGSRWRGRAEEN
ncbi:DgyrCDS3155 [Dimorphilus gyrociliatus]|uniref:DgyrCDS3155 n=1 Tax=Dimorphilus gyrociliatus TaxID=2664684 RepID=A0A7I8VCW3_9ANNE|nr:DgyrCDS3155 [Dimorphilus gyrociliatus]